MNVGRYLRGEDRHVGTSRVDKSNQPAFSARQMREMKDTNQLPPLPTPKFTETIRGVPCITVTEHEHLMRVYAQQALRPERVAMTDEQISFEAHNADDRDWNDLRFRSSWHEGFLEGAQFAEAHHGITAQAKKETP